MTVKDYPVDLCDLHYSSEWFDLWSGTMTDERIDSIRLVVSDPELAKVPAVREWAEATEKAMKAELRKQLGATRKKEPRRG